MAGIRVRSLSPFVADQAIGLGVDGCAHEEGPKNPVGKIDKPTLRKSIAANF
jgi:hypothetical protein